MQDRFTLGGAGVSGLEASNIGCNIRRRALINQLLTWSKVRLVCAAICRFSSSVGYGCCKDFHRKRKELKINFTFKNKWYERVDVRPTYNNVLKQPWSHNGRRMFWQHTSFRLLPPSPSPHSQVVIIIVHRATWGWRRIAMVMTLYISKRILDPTPSRARACRWRRTGIGTNLGQRCTSMNYSHGWTNTCTVSSPGGAMIPSPQTRGGWLRWIRMILLVMMGL